MDDIPFKYIVDNKNKNDALLNEIENKLLILNQSKIKLENGEMNFLENPKIKNQRSFLQYQFEILNPPNI